MLGMGCGPDMRWEALHAPGPPWLQERIASSPQPLCNGDLCATREAGLLLRAGRAGSFVAVVDYLKFFVHQHSLASPRRDALPRARHAWLDWQAWL